MRPRFGWTSPAFETVGHPGARILARPEAVAWVRFVLESGLTLHEAASRDRDAFFLEGRHPVYAIPAKVAPAQGAETGRWAVRHYARGGRFVAGLLGDRYFRSGRIRPFHEARVSEGARSRGIPTPRVVAAALYPSGVFYRGDLVTDFIPKTSDLVEALFDTSRKGAGGATERMDAIRAAGALIRTMAGVALRHRDLHARNILLEWRGAAPGAYLLDLDRAELGPEGKALSPRGMYLRLRRSLLKWERRTNIRLSDREWKNLEDAALG